MASMAVMTMPLGMGIGTAGGDSGGGGGSIRRARPRSRPRSRRQRGAVATAYPETGPTGIPEKDEQLQQQQPRRRRRRRRGRTASPQSPNPTVGAVGVPTNQKGYRRRTRTRPQRLRRVTFSDDIMTMSYSESDTTVEVVTSSRKESLPQFQYSREQLIEFSESPLAKVRPECLDPAFNNARGVWDPELWHLERKRSETPPDDRSVRDPADTHKRRSGDPRERIRKEQDGIILSPQRRSFNSGCYVAPAQQTLGRRSESPTNKSERERDPSHREVQSRRIGSGRIVTRDVWDFRVDKEQDQNSNEFGFQRNSTSSRDERFDRRSFGRDFDRDKDKQRNRYNDKRRAYSDSKEEEPEWFSGGPTSQNDKIDLGGFGDFIDEASMGRPTRKNSSQKSGKSNRSSGRKLSEPSPPASGGTGGQSSASSRRTPTPPGNRSGTVAQPQPPQSHSPIAEETPSPEKTVPEKGPLSPEVPSDQDSGLSADQLPQSNNSSFSHQHQGLDFNLDDFLKSDSVPGLLANGAVNESSGGSRFSQWFRRESPVNRQTESRCSSIQDELLNNLISDITEPAIVIPPISESNTYFTPISPAENTATQQNVNVSTDCDNAQKSSLLEMLQRRPQGDTSTSVKTSNIRELEVTGKIHSVEELEAKIRQGMNSTESQNAAVNANAKKEEDLSAFNKLLAQISDGKVIPATAPNGPLPSNIQQLHFTQMLKNSQQNRQVGRQTSVPEHSVNMVGGLESTNSQNKQTVNLSQQQQQQQQPQQQQQHMQIPKDLVMKLLQVQQQQQQRQQQQEMISKLLVANHQAQLAQQRQQQQQQQQQQAVPSHMGHFTVPPPVHPVLPTVPPSLSPLPPELQVMVNNAQPSHELLQRPEAKAILQGLRYGEITSHHLVQQLQNPAMQHRHREVLLSILKMQMQQGMVHRTASPHLHAGQAPDLLHQMMLQQQQQQHQQQQIRIPSPLNNAYCQGSSLLSPNMTVKPNTLTVQPPVLTRVPSPRELQLHTQNIMQSALIKKKLEEQRENYRKRQEMQQSLSPNVALSNAGGNSVKTGDSVPPKHISPTPLAFTPTSVLRKMTAEKDPENNPSSNRSETKSADQQKMLQQLPTNPPSSQQQSSVSQTRSQFQQAVPPNWNVNMPKQQQGRPIVKGNGNFHYGPSIDYQQQQQQVHQQRHNVVLQGSGNYGSNVGATRSKMVTHTQNVAAAVATQQLNNFMMMHRPPPTVTQNHPGARAQTLQAQLAGYQQTQQQQQQRNVNPAMQQILPNQNYNAGCNTSKPGTVAESRLAGGLQRPTQQQPQPQAHQLLTRNSAIPQQNRSTSPTSNQLARWFSPELLAQARAGQLPNMPPVPSAPNVLSLEELERLQQSAAAAAVHN